MSEIDNRYKVATVAAKYEITTVEDELAELWAREDDPVSLRDLATYFNKRILEAAMETAQMNLLKGEVENTYQLLTDDSVSSGVYTETVTRLEQNGIDVDQLESDFVSYQAVRTYLRNARDVERNQSTDDERIETVAESVTQLQNRTTTVTAEKLAQLDRTDRIDLGEFRVFLDMRIFCEDCETQYEISEILDRKGCQCDGSTSSETTARHPHD